MKAKHNRSAGLSRREWLKVGGVMGLAASVPGLSACQPRRATPVDAHPRRPMPRNVILLVSDGMSMGTLAMAEDLSQLRRGRGTVWHDLLQRGDVSHGCFNTQSRNSMVTDSAAAASAWGSGHRIDNGVINTLPDGQSLVPLTHRLKRAGKSTGLVVTDRMCGATPAGFAAAVANRNQMDAIAPQYIDHVDVLLGGGVENFTASAREDDRDLLSEYRQAGYHVCRDRGALLAASGRDRLLGLFGTGTLPYSIDHRQSRALRDAVPTLAEMTSVAMQTLGRNPRGFFLMVEAARVDHAAHKNDAAAMLQDQLAFDDAVAQAIDFAEDRDDTLVIVTTDHGNANPGLNGMGRGYRSSTQTFQRIDGFKASFANIMDHVRAHAKQQTDLVTATRDAITQLTDIELSRDDAELLGNAIVHQKTPNILNRQQNNAHGMLGLILGNHTGIQFNGTSHTSDYVVLTAVGPHADDFVGLHPLTHLHDRVSAYAKLAAAAR